MLDNRQLRERYSAHVIPGLPHRPAHRSSRALRPRPSAAGLLLVAAALCVVGLVFVHTRPGRNMSKASAAQPLPGFQDELKRARAQLLRLLARAGQDEAASTTVHVVMGNEACDADSVFSSLVLAYTETVRARKGGKQAEEQKAGPVLWVPLVNMVREDLALRGEVVQLLRLVNIDPKDLVFLDDVGRALSTLAPHLSVVLVDHNRLSSRQQSFAPYVTRIVDHHADERLYLEQTGARREITRVGSCCSLVTHHVQRVAPELLRVPEVALCLTAVVLLDTGNMDPALRKATDTDRRALALLGAWKQVKHDSLVKDSAAKLYSWLLHLRSDVSKLSTAQRLRKDKKQFELAGLRVGISGVPAELVSWAQQAEEEVKESGQRQDVDDAAPGLVRQVARFAQSSDTHLFVTMTVFTSSTGAFSRQLLLVGREDGDKRAARAFEAAAEGLEGSEELNLSPLALRQDGPSQSTGGRGIPWRSWTQNNVQHSRKKVLPLMQQFVSQVNKL